MGMHTALRAFIRSRKQPSLSREEIVQQQARQDRLTARTHAAVPPLPEPETKPRRLFEPFN